jgi:ATP-dependent helicase/DNAse subunit B
VRSRDAYAPVIETALARFGIPFRSYFTDPLAAHPAIAYLAGIVNCALGGWNHAGLAALVRMPVSGSGATADGDRLDFELRKQLPGAGFPLPQLPPSLSAAVAELETWMRERADAAVWAPRFKALTRFATAGPVEDAAGQEQVHAWRSTAAALRRFAELAEESAQFSSGRLSLAQFWKPLEAALAIEPLRVDDRRRNVVHVMDVFEARQWELPCVFVCGLLERDFPRYHSEDPIAGDAARRRAGLRTSADLQLEERFLFEMAVSRASEEVVLSYARFDEKGNETLPSFFLHDAPFAMCDARIRPAASRALPSRASSSIQDENLLEKLARSHRRLSASGVENFLQCPFQFFAGKTLRLRERPLEPRDRLDARAKGNILHKALAEWVRAPLLGAEVLNRTFEDECARLHIPSGYRTEAVRLELLRHFENFLADDAYELAWPSRAEEEFQFALNSSITIRGRIDRMDVSGDRAVVIDYKYSPGGRIRDHVDNTESGDAVQGGLYLMAVERAFQLQPAGMLFCGLKKDVSWGGWHVSIPGLQRVGEARRQEDIRELMEQAGRKVEETYALISQGRIAARPADTDKCRWCDFRDICRIESAAAAAEAGAR